LLVGQTAVTPFIDRICELILCAPEYARVKDPGIFNEMGVGFPPGGWRGGNICERCLGDFLGELEVIDDIYIKPPLVKWCCWKSERCSRWVSIGPTQAEDFGGIGRVAQLAIHPTNAAPDAPAAGGGVGTTNGGATWQSKMDLQPTLTMGGLCSIKSIGDLCRLRRRRRLVGTLPGVGWYLSQQRQRQSLTLHADASARFSAIVAAPDPIQYALCRREQRIAQIHRWRSDLAY
jgi:hypothetical protein